MEHLTCELHDHVATVTIQKPTMAPAFFARCGDIFRGLADNDEVRAVVLVSAVKPFSYGLDLPAAFAELGPLLAGGLAKERMALRGHILELQSHVDAVARCPVPVIAAVHGWCIGGGLDLISACDIRLCSKDARFSLRETRVAIVADLGSLQRLPAIIGQGNTRELAFTGKDIEAERALAMGLVNSVHEDREAVHAAARAMAEDIAKNAPLVVRGVKQVLDHGQDRSVAEGLEYVATWNAAFLASSDLGEALSAFVQKREPRYKGE